MIVKKKLRSESRSSLSGYIFISPWLIGFFVLTLWPIGRSLYLSLTDYSLLSTPTWVGLDNYSEILTTDSLFQKSIQVTFLFVLFSVPLKLFFSLMVALLLNKNIRGMKFYRTAIYFPSLIGSSVAVSILWRNLFGLDGYLNQILLIFDIHGKGWIADPSTALGSLVLLNVWQFGSTMVIFLAGLRQIPKDLYESSSVDGAGKIRQFFNITLPMLSPVMFFNLVLGVIGAFQTFTSTFIVTNGGPANATYMYAFYLYQKAFVQFQMGYASALAWILLLIVALLTAINFWLSKYWVYYEAGGGKSE